MMTDIRTANSNRSSLLSNKEKAARGWNHDGFMARMTKRLEDVRPLVQDNQDTAYQGKPTKIRAM